jgi:general secretion pathway protein A
MYNSFYGLSEKPFELTPDPTFVYFTPSHQEALDAMIDGIKKRWGFVSITGEVGTGKTTLIHLLLSRLPEDVKTVFIFHPTFTFRELLRTVLLELSLNVVRNSEASHLDQLSDYLLHHLDRDETVAVIIDEAQNLSEEVIRKLGELSELKPQISVRLQVIFVGQPEFNEKLNSQELRQLDKRIGVRRQIKTLTEKESKEYIEHRLKIVGCSSFGVFTPQAISMIIRHARGIPRIINTLCDNAFLSGFSLSVRRIDVDIIREVIGELEGQPKQETPRIVEAVKHFRLLSLRLSCFHWKFLLAPVSVFVLAGLIILTYGYSKRYPTIKGSIESIKRSPMDSEGLSSNTLPPRVMTKEIPKVPYPSSERDSESKGLPQPNAPLPLSPLIKDEKGILAVVITVEKGQTISSLAKKYYRMTNPTLVDLILDFNPEINNANLIQVNQKLRIPKITKEWLIDQASDHTYRLHVGTFWAPDFAKPYKDESSLKGKTIEILPRKLSPNETWYRVMVGPFDNKDEALKVLDLLKEKGLLPLFGGLLKSD